MTRYEVELPKPPRTADGAPECCGSPMYRCDAAHDDGQDYWHCRFSSIHNVPVVWS